MAEGVFPTSGIIPNSGFNSRYRETLPDIGKQFPMSGNSFRYRKTVSDVGEQFPISENGFRCRETVSGIGNSPDSRTTSRCLFPMSENDFRYRETVYAVGEHLDRFEQIRTEQESGLYYRSSQERIKNIFMRS